MTMAALPPRRRESPDGGAAGADVASRTTVLLFLLPAALVLVVVFALPILQTVYYSFTDWRGGMRPANFVGLSNYAKALQSERVLSALTHNVTLLLVIPVEIVLAVIAASGLRERVYGWRVYCFLLLVPSIISITIAGYAWTYFLSPQGIVNIILREIGLGSITRAWLGDETFALICVMGLLVWRDTGFAAVLFYSRLLAVDESIYEAAALDRANRWHRLIHIDFPLLKNVIILFSVLMSVWIFSFVFNYVYVMTGGGPGTASTVAELEIFREGFWQSRPGYASAISLILLVITLPLIALQIHLQVRRKAR